MPSRAWLLLLTVAIVLGAAYDHASPQLRREVRVGISGLPPVVDPATALDGAPALVARQVFDTLVQYRDLTTDIEPALATRWRVSRDGRVWAFTLRDGVRFHDGTPLTAYEVVASFERHLKPEDPQSGAGAVWGALLRGTPGVVKEISAPDPHTVHFTLVQPYAPLLTVLAHPGFGIARRATGADGVSRLVGTGPYRVVDVTSGRIALEAVPTHWAGPPRNERIVLLEVAGDEQAESELDSRSLDVWLPPGVPRRTDGAVSAPGLRVGYLAFQTEKEPFSKRGVRQAIASALGPAVLGVALDRSAVPLLSFLPPGVWARREGSIVVGSGPEAAKRVLAEGAWPKGFKPTLLVAIPPGGADPARLGETVEQLLGSAELPVQVRLESPDAARAMLEAGDYELALTEAQVTGGDPHPFLYPLSSYYRNPRLDDMLARASQLGFRPERERLYRRAQLVLAQELPWVPLYVRLQWAVVRPEVRGLRLHPTGFHKLGSIRLE